MFCESVGLDIMRRSRDWEHDPPPPTPMEIQTYLIQKVKLPKIGIKTLLPLDKRNYPPESPSPGKFF